ncbi:MAG: hypothetical protein ACQEQH_07510 [Bacillota bacterium]
MKEKNNIEKEEKELNNLSKIKVNSNANYKDIKDDKDVANKKKLKNLSKNTFKYWVYLFKDGRRVNSFGVNEEEYGDVKLLVRREEVKGENKIIFRELYPEPKYDLRTINNNKKQISKELNRLKQIEKKLEENNFASKPKEYNYDITDVKLLIQEKEIMLNSIKYGVTHQYIHDIREDGIPVVMYDMENSGLRLRKYIKESSCFADATENKKIESAEAKRQIDHQLKKKNDKDWQKIAIFTLWILLLAIATYGVWELMSYNKDREMQFCTEGFDKLYEKQSRMYDDVVKTIKESNVNNNDIENKILINNNEILKQCVVPVNEIPRSS